PIFVDVAKIQSEPVVVDLRRKYPQFDFIILMSSRLEKEKNIGLAISAMKEIVKKFPKTGLIIAGSGSEEKNLRLKVYGLRLQDNVKFEGWVKDLSSYYKTCDAYLLTSNYEGYGMCLIMAAASGAPIITTDVGVVGEVINKDNALVIKVQEKQAIIGAIIKLQTDDALRKELKDRAQSSVESLGSHDEYLKKYKQSWEI
ncbi:glycosyltransferase, partial [Patescibacteria group bacterium]|nr:glycosyltransferase [Patescibacteria group bacterium]